MSLKTISEAEARRLILNGTAGYWSIHPRSVPIPNETQTVIRLQGKLFIVPATDLKVSFVGYAGKLAGRHKGAFAIECDNDEIAKLAQAEMDQRGVKVGTDDMKYTPEQEGQHKHG
jgi:hypothetical protein